MDSVALNKARSGFRHPSLLGALWIALLALVGCRSPQEYREQADDAAYQIISSKQEEALGRVEPFTIEAPADTLRDRLLVDQNLPRVGPGSLGSDEIDPIKHWPEDNYLDPDRGDRPESSADLADRNASLTLSLNDALQVAARNNREYRNQKERVFRIALELDLEKYAFDSQFGLPIEGEISSSSGEQGRVTNARESAETSATKQLQQGALLTGQIAFDLTQLLTQGTASSLGLIADASIEVPLLRGAGRWVVTEPLRQAERNALYAIYNFENFKRNFAVEVAARYLGVLRQLDSVANAEENYRRLITSSRRAQALADQGRLPEIQVDQALQDELRARNGWISAQQQYAAQLDEFKILLGLPTDASVGLEGDTLRKLATTVRSELSSMDEMEGEQRVPGRVPAADAPIDLVEPDPADRGPLEMQPEDAIILAFENRLDLRVAEGGVFDSMRKIAVAADGFLPELTLFASGSVGERRAIGSATREDAEVRLDRGSYNALLRLDLPIERRVERDNYRNRIIDLEVAVRELQALEDRIKLEVRSQLRDMLESRESLQIQAQAVKLAERRVDSTGILLRLGRAEIRDVLDAQDSLLSAQNALTSALVNYRVSELQLQSNLGLLEVNEEGLWQEFRPERL